MNIRREKPEDYEAISFVTKTAFRDVEHSSQTEAAIIDALREASVLTVSLVAEKSNENGEKEIIGHIAFSPISFAGSENSSTGWYGLGPVSVLPEKQKQGIGSALVHEGLTLLKVAGAEGCVLLGDPEYYKRFGFNNDPRMKLRDVPQEYFLTLPFNKQELPEVEVIYHPAFNAS